MRINTLCLSLTIALLCACGSNAGDMNDVISHKRVNVRYPSEDYFTAIGYSDNGKIGEAIEDAKARVARSISSKVVVDSTCCSVPLCSAGPLAEEPSPLGAKNGIFF